jgi:hypothetical protein
VSVRGFSVARPGKGVAQRLGIYRIQPAAQAHPVAPQAHEADRSGTGRRVLAFVWSFPSSQKLMKTSSEFLKFPEAFADGRGSGVGFLRHGALQKRCQRGRGWIWKVNREKDFDIPRRAASAGLRDRSLASRRSSRGWL